MTAGQRSVLLPYSRPAITRVLSYRRVTAVGDDPLHSAAMAAAAAAAAGCVLGLASCCCLSLHLLTEALYAAL